MKRMLSLSWIIVLLIGHVTPWATGGGADVVAIGKASAALVEVTSSEGGSSGSAFCIDKIGLFVTNAHVVEGAESGPGKKVRVIVDIGLKTQKILKARVLRVDSDVDLALLRVEGVSGLTALELGKDDGLALTAEVTTFGFPFGRLTAVARDSFPDISVNRSRITSLRMDKGRLKVIQFDGKINPGNSGGPVLDMSGRVIGVAWATVRGADMNFAIPVGRLADFLASPGLVFEPPPLPYEDRSKPLTWTIKVQPPTPDAKLPADLGVTVSIASAASDEPRVVAAKSVGNGEFRASLTPVPRDPERKVAVDALINGRTFRLEIKDGEVRVGGRKLLASDIRQLIGGTSPRAFTVRGEIIVGPILGLPKVKTKLGDRTATIDLDQASSITIRPLDPPSPVRWIEARIEAKQAGKVIATVIRRVEFPGVPEAPTNRVVVRDARPDRVIVMTPGINRGGGPGAIDAGRLKIAGSLDGWDAPLSAGLSIRPPSVPIGDVQLGSGPVAEGQVRQFPGHSNGIWSVAISPDGRQVLSGSHDCTVRLWDATTGRELRRFSGHTDHVKAVAFLPDGVRGLSASDDDTLRLWDLRTGIELRCLRGHTADLSSVAVSGDGTGALTGACDRTARLWDLATGFELKKLVGHSDVVQSVALLPDGRRALTAGADGTARLWDLATGREVGRFSPKAGPIRALAGSPDGRLALVGSDDGTVRLWDHQLDKEVALLGKHDDPVQAVDFTPDGLRAISAGASKDHTIRVWDVAGSRELRGLRRGDVTSSSVKVSPDGIFVAGSRDRFVRLWDLPAAEPPGAAQAVPLERILPGKVTDVASAGGGRYLLLTMKEARKLAIFDVNVADVVKTIPLPSDNVLVAAGASKFVIAYPEERLIQRWDLSSMIRDADIPAASPIQGRLRRISLGSDSGGPILAAWVPEANNGNPASIRFSFLSLDSLKVLKVRSITTGGFQGNATASESGGSFTLNAHLTAQDVKIRASAGGGLFTLWNTDRHPAGFQTLQIKGAALTATFTDDDLGYLVPGPDGRAIYTSQGGRREPSGQVIGKGEEESGQASELTLPTLDPAYFLSVCLPYQSTNRLNAQGVPPPGSVSVRLSSDGSRLLTIRGVDEVFSAGYDPRPDRADFSIEKRLHFIPSAKLLVTITPAGDRLVLRRLDVEEAMGRLDGDYLFVISPGIVSARAGQTLEHQVVARSKAGKVGFAIADGPDGLRVLPDGKVHFPVPQSAEGTEIKAVITISDGSGQERFHTLSIRVR